MDELREFLNGRTVGVSLDGKWLWYGVYQRSNPMADEEVVTLEELVRKSSLFRKFGPVLEEDERSPRLF